MKSIQVCSIAGCENPAKSRNLCNGHYLKLRRYGDPLITKQIRNICSVDGCDKFVEGNGYCATHNGRYRKHGDPLITRKAKSLCSITGCGQVVRGLGLCSMHYQRQRKSTSKCSVDGCNKGVSGLGFCAAHYRLFRKTGDPLKTEHHAKTYFRNTVLAYTGDECLMWPFPWSKSDYYPKIKYGAKSMKVHRAVCFEVYGPPPAGKPEAAHSCGRGIDGCCNPKHLRWASRAENMADRYGD